MNTEVIKPERKFSSTSSSSCTTLLVPPPEAPKLKAPTLYYAVGVLEQIKHIVDKCNKEVGWWGLVTKQASGDYTVTEIFIPEQTVTGAETDISPEAFGALGIQLINENKDPGQLYYWGHSHVNMGVNPSGQDEDQVKAYLDDCPIFIREIRNKAGNSKVDIYDVEQNVVFQCVDTKYYYNSEETTQRLDALLAANVKEQLPVTQVTTHLSTTAAGGQRDYGDVQYYLIGAGAEEYARQLMATH